MSTKTRTKPGTVTTPSTGAVPHTVTIASDGTATILSTLHHYGFVLSDGEYTAIPDEGRTEIKNALASWDGTGRDMLPVPECLREFEQLTPELIKIATEAGRLAQSEKVALSDNPYPSGVSLHSHWKEGWLASLRVSKCPAGISDPNCQKNAVLAECQARMQDAAMGQRRTERRIEQISAQLASAKKEHRSYSEALRKAVDTYTDAVSGKLPSQMQLPFDGAIDDEVADESTSENVLAILDAIESDLRACGGGRYDRDIQDRISAIEFDIAQMRIAITASGGATEQQLEQIRDWQAELDAFGSNYDDEDEEE